jgi:hypothetical protein
MANEFGSVADDQGNEGTGTPAGEEGTNFGQNTGGETNTGGADQGIDPSEYEALRQRDEHAQQHITRLESENSELRDKVVELEDKLANATTLDEALTRISNQGEGQQNVDRTDVAQVVEEVLGQKQTEERMEANWSSVVTDLTKKYGDWKAADAKVQERAVELDISLEDATTMAKNNPKVFRTLFNLDSQSNTSSNPAGSHGAGATGQRGVSSMPGQVRDKSYYANLRKNDPNKYWSVDVQAQMRRDLFNQ